MRFRCSIFGVPYIGTILCNFLQLRNQKSLPFSSSLSSTSSSSGNKRKRDHQNCVEEPPNCKRPKHDLFVNYSDEDIGDSLISHVHGALHRNGFTISDRTKIPAGQEMQSGRLKAVEESEICVVVLSPEYASSVRCLDELVDIMDQKKKVFSVFFKVNPRDVKKQEGPFKKVFEAHTRNFDPHRVEKWRNALSDAGQLSGLHYQNGDEDSFICKIVKKLQRMQNPQELYVTDHPVGIESRVEEVLSPLRLDSKDVCVVAILGIGGIGKTTIAKATYNRIAPEFDASCFLEVFPYDCRSPTLVVEMQKLLISSLSGDDNLPMIHHHSQGVAMIRRFTQGRKLLLVLDDVTHVNLLEAFGINPFNTSLLNTCFGGGSRIIVTTRDKRSLGRLSYVSYNVPLLDEAESIELLTQLLYEKDDPLIDMNFLKEIAWCASGLPLVLEVWGLHFGHYEREEWPNVFKTLKAIPHDDVHKKLKISYDSLTPRAKKLFLDIACFFIKKSMYKELIVKVLQDEESAFFPEHEMQSLADRGLVTFKFEYGSEQVSMHNVIREMGEEIVRQENEDEPGQRTRLFEEEDVRCVLEELLGTQSVGSILGYEMTFHIEAFRKMNKLRLISLNDSNISGCDSEVMPPLSFRKLRYLEWNRFPMKSINIDMCNVVLVILQWSRLETLWEGSKV